MIHLILGENTFKAEQELARIVEGADVAPERMDAESLTPNTLADIVRGQSLFSDKRLVVLRQLSANKPVFEKLAEWADEISDDTTLVLMETSLDKRTKAYKNLVKKVQVIPAEMLTDRDARVASEWLISYAKQYDVKLTTNQAQDMVMRAMVPAARAGRQDIDQQLLATAVESLRHQDELTDGAIAAVLPPSVSGSVFDILAAAIGGNRSETTRLLEQVRRHDDHHMVFASLLSQWTQIVTVALVGQGGAAGLGIHPFAAQKSAGLAARFSKDQLREITGLAAKLDVGLKQSAMSPWAAVERLVAGIALSAK